MPLSEAIACCIGCPRSVSASKNELDLHNYTNADQFIFVESILIFLSKIYKAQCTQHKYFNVDLYSNYIGVIDQKLDSQLLREII